MSNPGRSLLLNSLKLFDVGLMTLAFMAAAMAALHRSGIVSILEFFSMRIKIQNFIIFLLFILIWHLMFTVSGLYTSRRLSNDRNEVIDVIKATSLGTVVILIGSRVLTVRMVTPLFLTVFWLISMVSTMGTRLALRAVLRIARSRGRNLRDIIIVGTNSRALAFARKLIDHPELGYRIAGFVDRKWEGMQKLLLNGFAVISDLDEFPQILRRTVVDEVVMALPFRSMHSEASRIASLCAEQGIGFRVLTSIFDLKVAHSSTEDLEGDALIAHSGSRIEEWPVFTKRILDVTLSALLIALFAPLLLIVAILIKSTSRGPVLFVQKRIGLNKRQFNVYKFRTMVTDAEQRMREIEHLNEVSGPVFKIKNDPRITPLGRILRKTSIDELPQLFNVLGGAMSLVGPRPLPVRDYEGFNEDWQRRRFSVKPGVTCLWQVSGRSSIPFEKWMELDLQYIDQWSLQLDFEILLLTIPAVFRGSGAA
jgi:exopolysaccharide biosynthesis polyprenyl glycosylphosphotransferase